MNAQQIKNMVDAAANVQAHVDSKGVQVDFYQLRIELAPRMSEKYWMLLLKAGAKAGVLQLGKVSVLPR